MGASAVALNGWIEIYKRTSGSVQNAFDIFHDALQKYGNSLELMLGKCEASEKLKKFTVTVDTVNNIIVDYKDFAPAYEMKARVPAQI